MKMMDFLCQYIIDVKVKNVPEQMRRLLEGPDHSLCQAFELQHLLEMFPITCQIFHHYSLQQHPQKCSSLDILSSSFGYLLVNLSVA